MGLLPAESRGPGQAVEAAAASRRTSQWRLDRPDVRAWRETSQWPARAHAGRRTRLHTARRCTEHRSRHRPGEHSRWSGGCTPSAFDPTTWSWTWSGVARTSVRCGGCGRSGVCMRRCTECAARALTAHPAGRPHKRRTANGRAAGPDARRASTSSSVLLKRTYRIGASAAASAPKQDRPLTGRRCVLGHTDELVGALRERLRAVQAEDRRGAGRPCLRARRRAARRPASSRSRSASGASRSS